MHDTTSALALETTAPVVDGLRRVAPQPLGTWMSRWWFLYTDTTVTAPATSSEDIVPSLPRYVFAA